MFRELFTLCVTFRSKCISLFWKAEHLSVFYHLMLRALDHDLSEACLGYVSFVMYISDNKQIHVESKSLFMCHWLVFFLFLFA